MSFNCINLLFLFNLYYFLYKINIPTNVIFICLMFFNFIILYIIYFFIYSKLLLNESNIVICYVLNQLIKLKLLFYLLFIIIFFCFLLNSFSNLTILINQTFYKISLTFYILFILLI